jgi:hypothetical protein
VGGPLVVAVGEGFVPGAHVSGFPHGASE